MTNAEHLFGKQVKLIRRTKKLTQAQLAEIVGLSVNYISQIETGEASPTFQTIKKLSEGLGVEIKELFDFTSWNKEPEQQKRG